MFEMNKKERDNLVKTPLNRSILFSLLQALIPGLLIWLLLDPSLNLLQQNIKDKISFWIMLVIALGALLFTTIFTFITWKCHLHEKDQFIFSCNIMLSIMVIYLSGSFNLSIWIRFIICLLAALIGTIFVSFILMLSDNIAYKRNRS